MCKQQETYIKELEKYKSFVKEQNTLLLTSLLSMGVKISCHDYIESYYFTVVLPTQLESDTNYIVRRLEDFNLLIKTSVSLVYGQEYLQVKANHPN